ncbi:MAG: alpha/beta fold hydrolase [Pseudolabrys sp.]
MSQVHSDGSEDWFRFYSPNPAARFQLVCFPHAGAGASFYRRWAQALPPSVELLAVQYPGREDRIAEDLIPDITELARAVSASLRRIVRKQVVLFGHSMGATLAFEVARHLEREGIAITHLFVSAQTAPSQHRRTKFHLQGDAVLLDEIRRLSATPMEIFENREVCQVLLPAIRNDYRAIETYTDDHSGRVFCPITVLLADKDTEVTQDEARGWSRCSHGRSATRRFSGGHFYLVDQWREVIKSIADELGVAKDLRPDVVGWPSTP